MSQRVILCSEIASASPEAAPARSSAVEVCPALFDGYSFQDADAGLAVAGLAEPEGLETVISDASNVNGRPRLKLARLLQGQMSKSLPRDVCISTHTNS